MHEWNQGWSLHQFKKIDDGWNNEIIDHTNAISHMCKWMNFDNKDAIGH
jgi:hypothetical protein